MSKRRVPLAPSTTRVTGRLSLFAFAWVVSATACAAGDPSNEIPAERPSDPTADSPAGVVGEVEADVEAEAGAAPTEEEVQAQAPASPPAKVGTPPAIDDSCTRDSDCAWSYRVAREDGSCCHTCRGEGGNLESVEAFRAYCAEHEGDGCPVKKCAKPKDAVCQKGHCVQPM